MDSTQAVDEIRAELLQAKTALTADLDKIDKALLALDPAPAAPRRGRPPGRTTGRLTRPVPTAR